MKNLKVNFIFNFINILSNLLFPIITFPYISRVLNPEGIGKVAFANSIAAYFLMLASLGIPLYGVREIAKVRENKEKLKKTLSEIFFINLITTVFTIVIYLNLIYFAILGKEKILLLIMGTNILLTFIGVEWFYRGLEEYKYITMRSLYIRIISLVMLFSFVKTRSDYIIYAMITVFATVGANIFNFIYLKKFTSITIKGLDFKRHFKPILLIFSMNIAISIYINLDNVMLGYRSTEVAVGLYSAGIKLVKLVLGIVGSLGVVLFPRISNYIENGMEIELKVLLNKALKALILISLPCFIGLYFTAREIILIFSGEGFIDAITTMKYLTPIIIFIGMSNFIGIQILYPRGEEKKVLISVIIGAIINFSLNWILIPKYAQNGAAIATVVAEGMVTFVQIILGYKYLKGFKFDKEFWKPFIGVFLMIISLLIIDNYNQGNIYINLINKILLGGFIYISSLIILKEKFTHEILQKLFKRRKYGKI